MPPGLWRECITKRQTLLLTFQEVSIISKLTLGAVMDYLIITFSQKILKSDFLSSYIIEPHDDISLFGLEFRAK
ncbi:MAG: hypothetical protein BA865_12530 [Desulfobacterales bacterium S5133MH4]|jgi:hypothetical protein|nr:MAG: hypothetical protein BA865_12530 [Desulfobacterales bacterium S5133MH4]